MPISKTMSGHIAVRTDHYGQVGQETGGLAFTITSSSDTNEPNIRRQIRPEEDEAYAALLPIVEDTLLNNLRVNVLASMSNMRRVGRMPLAECKETLLNMVMQCTETAMEEWSPLMLQTADTDPLQVSSSEDEPQGNLPAPQATETYRLDADSAAGTSMPTSSREDREWTRE